MAFTKRVYTQKNKIYLYGAGTIVALFTFLAGLGYYGINISTSGDIKCVGSIAEPCVSYINITTNRYAIVFPKTVIYFGDNPPTDYKLFKKDTLGRWRTFNISGKTMSNESKWELKLVGYKEINQTIKWGIKSGNTDIDPVWIGYSTDDFMPKLISNKADLTGGEAVFEYCNPTLNDVPFDSDKIDFSFNKVKGDFNTFEKSIGTKKQITVEKTKWNSVIEEKQVEVPYNGTDKFHTMEYTTETVDNGYFSYYNVTEEIIEYSKLSKNVEYLKPNECKNILIKGTWNAGKTISIDWIPEIEVSGVKFKQDKFAWWNTSWTYVRPITITNISALVDYHVKIQLNSTYIPNLNWSNNGSDVRFIYADNTTILSYWIENWYNATSPNNASIWVKTNQSQINMYYGNPTATSQSNISSTFIAGDDFTAGASATYTVAVGSATMTRDLVNNIGKVKFTGTSGFADVIYLNGSGSCFNCSFEYLLRGYNPKACSASPDMYLGKSNSTKRTAGVDVKYESIPQLTHIVDYASLGAYIDTEKSGNLTNHVFSLKTIGTNVSTYIDYNMIGNGTSGIPASNTAGYVSFGDTGCTNADGFELNVSWVRTRKTMATEPTVSIGAEETQTITPSIVLIPNPFTNTTLHGHNNYIGNITITAGIDLNNIVMSSLGGDLGTGCSGCSILYNPSTISSISSGNNRQVNITVVVPFGQSPNTLWTNIYATADEAYNTTNMSITIQSNTSMNISNSSLGIYNISYPNNNGNLKNLTIHNTGNRKIYNISNNITSSNITSLITFSNFSFNLSVLGTQNIQINYTIPTNTPDGLYTYTIYYINNSMTPISRYVTFSLNISGFVQSENITLYLNGTSADKFYELGNSINITACSNVTGTTVYINTTHPSLTNPIVNGTTCATYLWNTSNVVMNQFNNSATTQNHSANNISGITINSVTDLQSGSMYLRGYSFDNSKCYQETANVSTACGGTSTGLYSSCTGNGCSDLAYPFSNIYDGDWNTYTQANSAGMVFNISINYTKPTYSINGTWTVKTGSSTQNLTISNSCWNYDTAKILLKISDSYLPTSTKAYCYNGTWAELYNFGSQVLYEEAIWWNITNNYTYNLSIAIGNDAQNYWLPYMTLQDTYAITNVFKTNTATKNLTFSRGGTNVTYIQTPCTSTANALSFNVSGGTGTQNLNKVDGLSSKSLVFSTENSSNTFNLYLPKSSTVATAPVNITLTGSLYYEANGTLSGGFVNGAPQSSGSTYKTTLSNAYDGTLTMGGSMFYSGGSPCVNHNLRFSLVGDSGTKATCTSGTFYGCYNYIYSSCSATITGKQPIENVWVTVSEIESGYSWSGGCRGGGTYCPIQDGYQYIATWFTTLNQYNINNATNITIWHNGTNLNYQYLPELNSSVTLNVNLSSTNMNSYLTTCTQDSCPVPYTMKTTKRGNVTISGVNVDYTNSISNITYDVANDGTIDASISGNNIPNNNITIGTNGLNAMNYYIQGHCINNSVSVPIVATSQTAGTMALSNLIVNFSINPISLNISAFNLSGIGNIQVPIKYNADNWGILNTYGLSINALTDYNYTFTGWSDSLHNATQTVKLIWSNFSMKFPETWIDYTEFVPKSITSKNVTPTGQTDSNPIYNFSYLAREQPMNISIWLNESINSCVNITASTTSNKTDGRFVNTTSSNQIVSFNSTSGTKGIWMFADLQCSYPISRWLAPNFMISSKCSSC